MLDALVAEARLRWGLDPADGLQVFAAETLVGAPIEPSRPLLIVPLATLRAEATAVDGRRRWPAVPDRRAATRWRCWPASTRPIIRSAGSGRPTGRPSRR